MTVGIIFLQPAFLWGLLALAIPIAVHLFNFRRYRKVYFSNVDRLIEVKSEKRKVRQLHRWLVLLMRCLAVIFLVFAFAQPTLPGKGQKIHSGNTVVSVYLDNSFSMENSNADGSQLETAKRKAREIAAAYRPGDRYQLLSNTFSGVEFRWLSREEFLDAVDELAISPASRTLTEVASRQADFMRQSGAANRHAYLVSDFQTSIAANAQFSTLSSQSTTLVPLEGADADNLYIDTLTLDAPAYFVGGSVTVEATVRNDSRHDVEKLPVRLFVGGRERALATLDLPAGTSAKASLRFTIDSAGWLDGRVEITDYPVTYDDSYYFTLLAGQPIDMLLVGKDNENLEKLFSHDSAIHFQQSALRFPLSAFHIVLLNEPSTLSTGEAQSLATWVEEGGTLVVVPPAGADVNHLNGLLSLLQAPLLGQWSERPVKATAIDYGNSLYRGVFNGTNDEMEMPTVQGRYQLNDRQALRQPVITLADGSPLLSATPCGAGRLYLFSSPLTARWTDLVSQALFVPTLYNMALYSRPLPPPSYTLGTTAPIFLQHSYDPTVTPPTLSLPSSNFSILPDLHRVGNRSALLLHGELADAGIYTLTDEHLAFNYNRLESHLEYLTRDDVEALVDGLPNVTVARNSAKPLDDEIRARENGTPLWRWCILLALLALAGEILVLKGPQVFKSLKNPEDPKTL